MTFTNSSTLSASVVALGSVANPWTIATSNQLSGGSQIGAIHRTDNAAKDLILGPGPYNANGNGSGTMQHTQNNQYLLTSPSANHIAWILSYDTGAYISADSKIDAARLTFGLTFTNDFEEDLTLTPEAGSAAMMLGGIFLTLAIAGRRSSKQISI